VNLSTCNWKTIVFISLWAAWQVGAKPVPIENASFEAPMIDPNGFAATPTVDQWREIDLDTYMSTNTGVFVNTPVDSPDHIDNALGRQLAFLGSERGNALEQDLTTSYQVGHAYRLTVAVAVSAMFPPSDANPADTLELVLFYDDGNEPVDIVTKSLPAADLSSTTLRDVSVVLPGVQPGDPWADQVIGIALRAAGQAGGFWDLDNVRLEEYPSVSVPVANASFESPVVDPCGFGADPRVDQWDEIDLDGLGSTNTGVFANTDVDSPDHLVNADGHQLAFLGSEHGNALTQALESPYRVGYGYLLTVGVGVSGMFPPAMTDPIDTLELAFTCTDGNDVMDAVWETVPATGLSSTTLQDFTVYLPPVQPDDPWADQPVGIALRAAGAAGGFWDLDHVRVQELALDALVVENSSFETPWVDPNGFGAVPVIDQWQESDLDMQMSANTGVFMNTPVSSADHITNARGRQLAFLGSETGNGLEQTLEVAYQAGCGYRLTVAVAVSATFPPRRIAPMDTLELAFRYYDNNQPVDIAVQSVPADGLSSTRLRDFSVYLPAVQPDDPWVDQPIDIVIQAAGAASGFWDLDAVRLGQSAASLRDFPSVKE